MRERRESERGVIEGGESERGGVRERECIEETNATCLADVC